MKMLITGASGFIGGRLIRYLLERGGVQIRAASRTQRSWPAGVEGCVADIEQPATLRDACSGMDAVVNLASMGERLCSLDPCAALRVNAGGTFAWTSAANSGGVSRFVQVSTSKVYGNNPNGVITEESPCAPQSHYAITHRAAEDYAVFQHPNSVVLRLANGFGAPDDSAVDGWGTIVNQICRQAVLERRIIIKSSGMAWRNFIPMQDVVRVLDSAAIKLPAGIYNVGSHDSIQLRALAERISQVCANTLGFLPVISTGPAAEGEQHIPLDYRIEKLATAGFNPTRSFDDEVSKLLRAV